MQQHSTEHIRNQRRRYSQRRYQLVNRTWLAGVPEGMTPGHFAKWNASCNCGLCNRQNWPDTRPSTVGAALDFKEALLELAGGTSSDNEVGC